MNIRDDIEINYNLVLINNIPIKPNKTLEIIGMGYNGFTVCEKELLKEIKEFFDKTVEESKDYKVIMEEGSKVNLKVVMNKVVGGKETREPISSSELNFKTTITNEKELTPKFAKKIINDCEEMLHNYMNY